MQSGSQVAYGTSVTLTANPNTGYDFVSWYADEQELSDANPFVFTMGTAPVTLTARFTLQKRSVTLYDGTDLYDVLSTDYNTTVSLPHPVKANYDFIGWYEDRGLTHAFDGRAVTEPLTLFAKWEKTVITFEVRFVDWDGSQIGAVQTVEQGNAAIEPATPRRTGYEFAAWSTDAYLSVTESLTVQATYTKQKFAVSFYLNEEDAEPTVQQVAYLESAEIPKTPIKDGYLFAGWKWNGYDYDFTTPVDEAIDLVAAWTEKPAETFTVRFYNETGDEEPIDTQTVERGKAATAPQTPVKVGFRFLAWDKTFDEITADTDVFATYETATFTVTFRFYSGSTEKEEEQTVNYGEAAIVPADYARQGYDFTGWDQSFASVTEDLTVTAQYQIQTYTATFYRGEEVLDSKTATYGASFEVPATPQVAGYSFIGWYSDVELTSAFDFTAPATASVPVYGKFEQIKIDRFTVSFKDYDGTVISTQTVVSGKGAIAPGNPSRVGYTFVGWDKSFDAITDNTTVTAQYSINTYSVKYYAEDRTTLLDTKTVPYGTDASALVTAPTVTGKTFLGWSADLRSITKETTVYAIYDAHVVTVYFMDGENEISRQSVRYGQTASVPNTPSKVDYIFKYWCSDPECEHVYDFNTPIEDENGVHIYAKWEEASGIYSVYFKDYDGRIYGNVQRVMAGYYATEPSEPEKDGVTFDGWYIEGTDTKFNFDTMAITGSLTLVARAKNS